MSTPTADELREALDYYEPQGIGTGRLWNALLDAARLLADILEQAERLERCEVHGMGEATSEQPGICWGYEGTDDCRMVPYLRIPSAVLAKNEEE